MSSPYYQHELPGPSSNEMPMFMNSFFDEEQDKDSVGLISVDDSWSTKSDTITNTDEPSGTGSDTKNFKNSTVSSTSGKVFDLRQEDGAGHGEMPHAPSDRGTESCGTHSPDWAAILGFQVDSSSPNEDTHKPTITETHSSYEAVDLAANSFESRSQTYDGFGNDRCYAEGSEYQSSGYGDDFGNDRDNESFDEGEDDDDDDDEDDDHFQNYKRDHWDAFQGEEEKPVSLTSVILDRCLETIQEDVGSSYVTSAMEFLAEDSFLLEPPAKKQRSSCMEIIDAAFEAQVNHSREHIQTMNTIEHSMRQLQRENAQLRRKLGITPQQALASMAAEYHTNKTIPVESNDDQSEWHDSVTASWGMDGETFSFLKKYMV